MGRYLQETIPLVFHLCLLTAGTDKRTLDRSNTVANSLRTLGRISSSPKAFEGFKPFRSLVTPSLETQILSMKGTDLSRRAT